ncbi:LolA family protein [Halomonas sp. M20]|uniref:LolA family protein n=1 Tax=Halomonas sp. M20 TaxID=2763264 RepID=UPI001D0ACB20|nr:hypothetical protein [Halomonas sp. M20]
MKYLASGLLLLCSLHAQAFELDEWGEWQAATPAFQSQIEQSRWLEEAQIRVHASGQMLFTPYETMAWRWVSPVPRLLVLEKAGQLLDLSPQDDEATATPPLEKSDDNLPGEQQIATLLMHALSGDLAALKKSYHLLLEGDRDAWEIILLPQDRSETAPKKLTLKGGRFINELTAISSEDNKLTLELSDHHRLVNAEGPRYLFQALQEEALAQQDSEHGTGNENKD